MIWLIEIVCGVIISMWFDVDWGAIVTPWFYQYRYIVAQQLGVCDFMNLDITVHELL